MRSNTKISLKSLYFKKIKIDVRCNNFNEIIINEPKNISPEFIFFSPLRSRLNSNFFTVQFYSNHRGRGLRYCRCAPACSQPRAATRLVSWLLFFGFFTWIAAMVVPHLIVTTLCHHDALLHRFPAHCNSNCPPSLPCRATLYIRCCFFFCMLLLL